MTRKYKRYTADDDSTIITDAGIVTKIYPDDDEGFRHQRFIVRLNGGQTLLIVHNIDLVDRIPIILDDYVEFKGEYEFNHRGGLVHWTHHDPLEIHEPGWIRHAGFIYQ